MGRRQSGQGMPTPPQQKKTQPPRGPPAGPPEAQINGDWQSPLVPQWHWLFESHHSPAAQQFPFGQQAPPSVQWLQVGKQVIPPARSSGGSERSWWSPFMSEWLPPSPPEPPAPSGPPSPI